MPRNKLPSETSIDHAAIKAVAWAHIAANGVPLLSLRAIARDLHITAPALYYYYNDRDALIAALAADTFESLADALIRSYDALPAKYIGGQIRSVGRAYREWALSHPNHYHLVFGQSLSPLFRLDEAVRYHAMRAIRVMVTVMQHVIDDGRLNPAALPAIAQPPPQEFFHWTTAAGTYDYRAFIAAHAMWAHVHGLVSSEVIMQVRAIGGDYPSVYEHALDRIIKEYVLPS